jgi:large subunit ribosomal protein L31
MKAGIHPNYHPVKVHCAGCSNEFTTRSTSNENVLRVEICYNCHPFFTGKQKFVDTAGRVERFQKKFGKALAEKRQAKAAA